MEKYPNVTVQNLQTIKARALYQLTNAKAEVQRLEKEVELLDMYICEKSDPRIQAKPRTMMSRVTQVLARRS